jgi:hypothetical protein
VTVVRVNIHFASAILLTGHSLIPYNQAVFFILICRIKMKLPVIISSLTSIFFAMTATAAGVSINPGQWEMTTTMTMTMMPQPRTTTVVQCLEDAELDPENFNMDEDNPCEISEVIFDGNNASWSITCSTDIGMVMQGQWEFTSSGDSITGSGSMFAEIGAQKMDFNMNWEGKRIGDCE